MLPTWTLSAPYADVEQAWKAGRLTDAQWIGYRAMWRYSAWRLSDLVPWPPVRAINRMLDTGASDIRQTWDAGTPNEMTCIWPMDFAQTGCR